MKNLLILFCLLYSVSVQAQLSNGSIYKIKNAATGKYLRAGAIDGHDANGLFQYPFTDDNAFKWMAVRTTTPGVVTKIPFFKLKNILSGKFIAVTGGSANNGAAIIHYQDAGQADIKWQPIAAGKGYKLKNSGTGKMLAVEGGSTADGARIIQWADNNQADIVWRPEPVMGSVSTGVTVPKRTWRGLMNLVLATMRLRINNYTPTAGQFNSNNTYKFTKPDDCTLKIGLAPHEVENRFNLFPSRFEPATLYFNDINKRTATVVPVGNTLKITLKFEETGQEVLGNCIDNFFCGGGMWWIDLANVNVDLFLEPTIERGKITYRDNARAVVTGKAVSVGMNVIVENLNNDVIFNQASLVFANILNRADIKDAFTEALNANMTRLPVVLPNPLTSLMLLPNGDMLFR